MCVEPLRISSTELKANGVVDADLMSTQKEFVAIRLLELIKKPTEADTIAGMKSIFSVAEFAGACLKERKHLHNAKGLHHRAFGDS